MIIENYNVHIIENYIYSHFLGGMRSGMVHLCQPAIKAAIKSSSHPSSAVLDLQLF